MGTLLDKVNKMGAGSVTPSDPSTGDNTGGGNGNPPAGDDGDEG